MKSIFFALSFLLLFFLTPEIVFAQRGKLKITPKKVVYRRQGVDDDWKKTFTVIYPVITGAPSLAIKRKIENTISYWRVFDTPLAEHLGDYTWLTSLSYQINYNKNGILDISLTRSGVGAYPDDQTENFVINLKTGKNIKAADVFLLSKSNELAAAIRKAQLTEIRKAVLEIKKDNSNEGPGQEPASDEQIERQFFAETNFTIKNLDSFRVSDKGITFLYDYDFNHASQALEPAGHFFYSFEQLKPFIRRNSVLDKLIR